MTTWHTTNSTSTNSSTFGTFTHGAAFYSWAPPPVKLPPWGLGFFLDFVGCPPGACRLSVASDDEEGLTDTMAMLNRARCVLGDGKAEKKRGVWTMVIPLSVAALASWRSRAYSARPEPREDLLRCLPSP